MRNILEVIGQMQKEIPLNEEDFHIGINNVANSVAYTAPELIRDRWVDLARILGAYMPDRNNLEPWQVKIADIFEDKVNKND